MAVQQPIFDVNIDHVKPKYFLQFLQLIPQGVELIKKYGAEFYGHWIVEAGATCEVIFIFKWGKIIC